MKKGSNPRVAVILGEPVEYNTSSMIRIRNIINALFRIGCHVDCYSPYPDLYSKYYSEKIELNTDINLIRYGDKIVNPLCKQYKKKNKVKERIINVLYYLYKQIDLFGISILYIKYKRKISKQIGQCDILLTLSDPKATHIIGNYCKKKNPKIKYVQQWGDPLTIDITETSKLPKFLKKVIEGRLLKNADSICYVSPITMEVQKGIFPQFAKKICFVPVPCEQHLYNKDPGVRIRIGYVGSYSFVARNIMPFYNVAKKLKEIDFEIVGDSEKKLEETENIKIFNRVPHYKLNEYIKSYDVLVCLMNDTGTQIPGKIFNYAGSDKEILIIEDGNYGDRIRSYFEKYDRFTFVKNTEEDIVSTIKDYMTKGIKKRIPLSDFMPERIAQQLISIER